MNVWLLVALTVWCVALLCVAQPYIYRMYEYLRYYRGGLDTRQPITAWRAFNLHITWHPRGVFLIGQYGRAWGYSTMTASCIYDEHTAPHPDCTCGIYALLQPPPREDVRFEFHQVAVARVRVGGDVVIHKNGIRAQHCVMDALFVITDMLNPELVRHNPDYLEDLRTKYQVPVYQVSLDQFYQWGDIRRANR